MAAADGICTGLAFKLCSQAAQYTVQLYRCDSTGGDGQYQTSHYWSPHPTRGHRNNTTLTLVYCSTGLIILTAVSCVISSGNQAILTKGQKIALDCCTELRTAGPTALIRHRVGERLGGRRDCSATLSVIKPAESLRLSLPAQYYSTAHCTQVHCRRLPSVRL